MRIAVDAMGGDKAPSVVAEGALLAAKEYGYRIVLVGQKEAIEKEFSKYKKNLRDISIHHASEVVEMGESPAVTIRKKKDSSINVMIELARAREVDAVVSAGNTGAVVCAATLGLGLLQGIERPGIGVIMPNLKGAGILIDAGANIDAKPQHLLQYGIMGEAYARYILNIESPKVGLLNIGEEETKGTDFVKESFRLLSESDLNFIGNIEGKDIFTGECDVIVCDGFIGNVALKVSESLAETVGKLLKRELNRGFLPRLSAIFGHRVFKSIRKEMDYAEYGGALLLGIDGVCIIAHGSSTAKAIKNAIRVAAEEVEQNVNERIITAILPKENEIGQA